MDEALPLIVTADVQRIAHTGSAGNCQTDRDPDGVTWPATCQCVDALPIEVLEA